MCKVVDNMVLLEALVEEADWMVLKITDIERKNKYKIIVYMC